MEILLIAMVMSSVVTKWIQDGWTDRSYAAKGMVSPRYQERLAKLEKAGRPNARSVASERGPLRSYLSELYADAVQDLAERHRARRSVREPFDPTAPTLRQRFSAGVLAEIADYKRKANWSQPQAEPATEPAVSEPAPAPVEYEPGTVTFDESGERIPLSPPMIEESDFNPYAPPAVGDRYTDDMNGRVYEWDGAAWMPVCSRCDKPMNARDGKGYLACEGCEVRAIDDRPQDNRETNVNVARTFAVYQDEGYNIAARRAEEGPTCEGTGIAEEGACPACGTPEERRLADLDDQSATTGGTTMTGEAVNYETTVAAIDAAEAQVATIEERLDGADQAVAELRGTVEQLSAGMAALRLDDASAAGVNGALEALDPEKFSELYQWLSVARIALAEARDNVIATYGDAAATVAATGVDEAFLATA